MPIIKSAKKRMRQEVVRKVRNFAMRRKLKTTIKSFVTMVKDGKTEEAMQALPGLQKVIDTADKKNLMHWRTAARKKALYSKMLAEKK